jgi:hypothetical protein
MPWSKVKPELNEPDFLGNQGMPTSPLLLEAVREALDQALGLDARVFVMGRVDDPAGMFGSTLNLHKKYGPRSSTPLWPKPH